MNSSQIAKKSAYRVDDVISLYGNAYKITRITDVQVLGVQVVENGRDVDGKMVFSLNLTLNGWRLVVS